MPESSNPPKTWVRDHLVRTLEADLIGPFDLDNPGSEELLPLPPARWYLTGFLAPITERELEDPEDDGREAGNEEEAEDAAAVEPGPKRKNFLPASLGLSVLLPPGGAHGEGEAIEATVHFAEYQEEPVEGEGSRSRKAWRRVPRSAITVALPLDREGLARGREVPETGGLRLQGKLTETAAPGLPEGTRALSLFLVNGRADFVFQVGLEVACKKGFVPRPNRRDEGATDWDDRVADLQYRDHVEYAVGHGVSVEAEMVAPGAPVCRVRTVWIPRQEVPRLVTHTEAGVETRMAALGELTDSADGASVRQALERLPAAYGEWILRQRAVDLNSERRRETREELLRRAERARQRIAEGIQLLATDGEVLEAFRLANRAMDLYARQRGIEAPRWRLFQLAFLLLSLPSMVDDTHPDRDTVELIFFPTGGGKTEAYLGLIACTLVLRRLRGRERPDGGLGVAVLLRYTLRLLTLDQLGRAATLVCALEILRGQDPRLGEERFAIGLWVGKSATANTLKEVARAITEYKNSAANNPASPFPLTDCPWCTESLGPGSLTLLPDRTKPQEVVAACLNPRCEFCAARRGEGLPVLFVDEQIYRELPAFLVATVDKFAMLPWRGETGMLFGRAQVRQGRRFYGPMDSPPRQTAAFVTRLPDGLRPPELIVQDELHLISGPLGTMVGLYETAVERLSSDLSGDRPRRPKVVASTATVRRAQAQVKALFGRESTALFPPPGVDPLDTFFATVDRDEPGRLYIGLAAPGRAFKALLLRSYIALPAAAARAYDPAAGEHQTADGYMTLAGYFNSLRELGGMRRLVEDEVRTRVAQREDHRPLHHSGPHPWVRDRRIQAEPVELTSREPTAKIARSKARLARPWADEGERVDVLLASNMISVGVDIDRLGLMVVAGQPKTTSEYIQATSRVGRNTAWPGLVVTCLNVHKPRDRSHYERFATYHASFYRAVEAMSLTPFSGPALDRGLAGVLVAMCRLGETALTPSAAMMQIGDHREVAEAALRRLAQRGEGQGEGPEAEEVRRYLEQRGGNLLDAWQRLADQARQQASPRRYSPFDRDGTGGKALLFTVLEADPPEAHTDDAKFSAPTSMRDVEPSVHLWLRRRLGSGS